MRFFCVVKGFSVVLDQQLHPVTRIFSSQSELLLLTVPWQSDVLQQRSVVSSFHFAFHFKMN